MVPELGPVHDTPELHTAHPNGVREAPLDAVPFSLAWTEIIGTVHADVIVCRGNGTVIHPRCREFTRTGGCRHLDRAIEHAENPCEAMARDLINEWALAWPGGVVDKAEYAAHCRRQLGDALARLERLTEWRARPAEREPLESIIARYGA